MEYPKKIRALINRPDSGKVMKGEIGIYIRKSGNSGVYDFPSQKSYHINPNFNDGERYEIVYDELTYEIY